jgi:hypothetical protein
MLSAPAMARSSRSPGPGLSGKSAQCNTHFVESIEAAAAASFFTRDPSNRSLRALAAFSETFWSATFERQLRGMKTNSTRQMPNGRS